MDTVLFLHPIAMSLHDFVVIALKGPPLTGGLEMCIQMRFEREKKAEPVITLFSGRLFSHGEHALDKKSKTHMHARTPSDSQKENLILRKSYIKKFYKKKVLYVALCT